MKTMISKTFALAAVAALAWASQSDAQAAKPKAKPAAAPAPAAAPSTPPVEITATVPGLCVLSREALLQTSTVGLYVTDRMKQLSAVVRAELTTDQTSLENDAKALEGQKASLDGAVYAQRGQALQLRGGQFQEKVQLRQREMEATQQKAYTHILQAAGPFVGQTVTQHGCGVLLDANAVIVANPSTDITPGVTQLLNGSLTQFAIDREHLDAAGAPAH